MTSERYAVFAPLSDFLWKGECFKAPLGIEIRRLPKGPDLRGLNEVLGRADRDILMRASHWFCFEMVEGETISGAEAASLFLLALWLVKPTKTHIALRFEVVPNSDNQHLGSTHRMFDRFGWIPGYVEEEVYDRDLVAMADYLPILREILLGKERLLAALDLTSAGCMAFRWKVGLICHAAAVEALLTYREGPRVTKRLATTYACLMATDKAERDQAFLEFYHLYGVRSTIMHGRFDQLAGVDEFESLARLECLLRGLWRKVLSSPELLSVLSSGDAERKPFFEEQQLNYQPPKVKTGNPGLQRTETAKCAVPPLRP